MASSGTSQPAKETDTLVGEAAGSSCWVGITNLSASVLGITILSMPMAMSYTGYILGPALIILMGVLADISLCMMVQAAKLTKATSYSSLGRECFGAAGDIVVLAALLSVLLGCAISALLVATQLAVSTVVNVFQVSADHPWVHTLVVSAIVLALTFPLTLLPNLSMLAPTSTVAMLGLLYVLAALVLHWVQSGSVGDVDGVLITPQLSSVLFISAAAYICHFNILPIYEELKPSHKPHIFNVIHTTILGISTPIYILFGLAGYFQLGAGAADCSNALLCFTSPLIRAGTVAIGLTSFLKYPLLVLPFRDTLNEALFRGRATSAVVVVELLILSAVVHALTYTIGDVGRASAIVGATSGMFIMFILPGAFYARAHYLHVPDSRLSQVMGCLLVVVGLVVMVLGINDVRRG